MDPTLSEPVVAGSLILNFMLVDFC